MPCILQKEKKKRQHSGNRETHEEEHEHHLDPHLPEGTSVPACLLGSLSGERGELGGPFWKQRVLLKKPVIK